VATLKAFPEGAALSAGEALEASVTRAATLVTPCFAAFGALIPRGQDDDRLVVDRALRAQPAWADPENAWAALDVALRDVRTLATRAADLVSGSAPVEEPDAIAGEIETASRRLEDLRSLLEQLVNFPDRDTVVWLSRDQREGTATLSAAPLDVGPQLWEAFCRSAAPSSPPAQQ
jgi:hypothetical protein